eukprot:3027806-Pyramimonas_sp.AAC.1
MGDSFVSDTTGCGQTWERRIIPQSLEAHGIWIIVDEEAILSWNRREYMEARIKRQGGFLPMLRKNAINNRISRSENGPPALLQRRPLARYLATAKLEIFQLAPQNTPRLSLRRDMLLSSNI